MTVEFCNFFSELMYVIDWLIELVIVVIKLFLWNCGNPDKVLGTELIVVVQMVANGIE